MGPFSGLEFRLEGSSPHAAKVKKCNTKDLTQPALPSWEVEHRHGQRGAKFSKSWWSTKSYQYDSRTEATCGSCLLASQTLEDVEGNVCQKPDCNGHVFHLFS